MPDGRFVVPPIVPFLFPRSSSSLLISVIWKPDGRRQAKTYTTVSQKSTILIAAMEALDGLFAPPDQH